MNQIGIFFPDSGICKGPRVCSKEEDAPREWEVATAMEQGRSSLIIWVN